MNGQAGVDNCGSMSEARHMQIKATLGHTAVVLVGFGSPLDTNHPREFLAEVFSDPVSSPLSSLGFMTKPFAYILSVFAEQGARKRYQSISGLKSSRQVVVDMAELLQERLKETGKDDHVVVPASRYGEPSLRSVLAGIAEAGIRDVIVLPLFPHRSIAATGSIEAEVRRICMRPPCYDLRVRFAGSWFESTDFVMAWVDAIREALRAFPIAVRDRVHLLCSAHSVPTSHVVERGDRYREEVEESANLISDSLGRILPMSVGYQSAPTWGGWIGPSIEDELTLLGMKRQRDCLIAPIGFVYDNVETWCDIDMDILPYAASYKIDRLKRVAPPSDSPRMINAMVAALK